MIRQNYSMETVACDFCGENDSKFVFKKPDTCFWQDFREFTVVECKKCGLGYLNPRPTQKTISYFYPQSYYDDFSKDFYLRYLPRETQFLPYLTQENVLDIGCARGHFLACLKQIYPAIKTYGVDLFSGGVNFQNIQFYPSDLMTARFNSDFFDIITAWGVMEHVYSPNDYFKEIARILKKGGKFIFLVPNLRSFWGSAGYWEDVPRHLYFFSEESLKKYGMKYGLKINNVVYDDTIWDGRGSGTFRVKIARFIGASWEKQRKNMLSKWQIKMLGLGSWLDSRIFRWHWEALLRRSGTMIVEMQKQ